MRCLVALLSGIVGCGPNVPFAPSARDAGPPPVCDGVIGAAVVCIADRAYTCSGSSPFATRSEDCARSDRECAPGLGCLACAPGRIRCAVGADGSEVRERCSPDGARFEAFETCDVASGLRCSADGCLDLCAEAEAQESYIGCEYAAVTLRNSELSSAFSFAIAIANPGLVPARVVIEGGALGAAEMLTVAPGGLEVRELPWVQELRGSASDLGSVRVPSGAYRVRSDVPVTATQFNPLRFRESEGCTGRECFSYTNDASLLLPSHVLTGSYLAVSRATQRLSLGDNAVGAPGFVTLVGVGDAPIDVEIRSSANTAPGGGLGALSPGMTASLTLMPGEVVQITSAMPTACSGTERTERTGDGTLVTYCDLGAAYDLTGTEIRGSGPLAVFVGHDCTFVPFDRWACDHLEEQLFPVEALGNEVFLPVTEPLRANEPNVVRIVSVSDGNAITFDPPLAAGEPPRMLDRGAFFEVELTSARWVRGTSPLLGALFLVGQDYRGLGTAGAAAVGDPAMALAVPSAQFRTRYDFLTPATYTRSTATIVAPVGARVIIDDALVALLPVEGTALGSRVGTAIVNLSPGVHASTANAPFGLYLTGYASYTSYFVPGGMDFEPITPPF